MADGFLLELELLNAILFDYGQQSPHTVFLGDPVFRDEEAQGVLRGQVAELLQRQRISEDMLRILARPQREHYGLFQIIQGDRELSLRVLFATTGNNCVFALRQGNRVKLSWIDPEKAVRTLVEQMQEVPAARIPDIRVHWDEIDMDDFTYSQRPPIGYSPGPNRRLADLMRKPRFGGAEFYAAGRDRSGHRVTHPGYAQVMDIADVGRVGFKKGYDKGMHLVGMSDDRLVAFIDQLMVELWLDD
jgi:hypothetical protein